MNAPHLTFGMTGGRIAIGRPQDYPALHYVRFYDEADQLVGEILIHSDTPLTLDGEPLKFCRGVPT